jgi:hypothetical protein
MFMKYLATSLFCLSLLASPALGAVISLGKGPSFGDLKSACSAAGGEFVDQTADDLGYSCHVGNCDGKGGECKIDCGTAGCTATTPIVVGGKQTLLSILQNGNLVFRGDAATPPSSLSEPSRGGAAPVVDPPPVLDLN